MPRETTGHHRQTAAGPGPSSAPDPKRPGRHRRDSRSAPATNALPHGLASEPGQRHQPGREQGQRAGASHGAPSKARKLRWQQEAGIQALISLAMSTAPTVIMPALPASPDLPATTGSLAHAFPGPPLAPETAAGRRPLGTLRARLRTDHMVRNSLYLILSVGLQAALGFAFWIIAARLFSSADVGKASSLIAATGLISFAALFGLNNTFVRYLPTARDRDAMMTGGLLLVGVCGAVMGLVYVLLTPVLAPRLAFVAHSPALAAGFMILTAAAAANLLTDSVFIAARKSGYTALTDGGIGGVSKIVAAVVLAGTGAYGLYTASIGGLAAAALASLLLMITAMRWRPSLGRPLRTLRPLLRFSAASYVGNVLSLLPTLVVPVIVLDRIGASAAAYYFAAFQVAALLYSASYAVAQASLAEGSHDDVNRREVVRRSWRVMTALCVPACLLLIAVSHWVLLAFGPRYSQQGRLTLIVLLIAGIPIAANSWLWTVLRLSGHLKTIVLSGAVYGIGICGLAWFLAPHGLATLAAAWPIGALLGVAVAAWPLVGQAHRRPSPRPQRPEPRQRANSAWS